jgi:hypothetical protein
MVLKDALSDYDFECREADRSFIVKVKSMTSRENDNKSNAPFLDWWLEAQSPAEKELFCS